MADGGIVAINPQYVMKVYPTTEGQNAGGTNKYVTTGARCIVTTSDGKFMAVREPCEVVRLKLEGKMK